MTGPRCSRDPVSILPARISNRATTSKNPRITFSKVSLPFMSLRSAIDVPLKYRKHFANFDQRPRNSVCINCQVFGLLPCFRDGRHERSFPDSKRHTPCPEDDVLDSRYATSGSASDDQTRHHSNLAAKLHLICSMSTLTGGRSFISRGTPSVIIPSGRVAEDSFALGWDHPNFDRAGNLGGSFRRKTPPINRFLIETPIASNLESRYFALLD